MAAADTRLAYQQVGQHAADRQRDEERLEVFAAPGQCVEGECSYASALTDCALGCAQGACAGDPCEGVTCDQPPGPENVGRAFDRAGLWAVGVDHQHLGVVHAVAVVLAAPTA